MSGAADTATAAPAARPGALADPLSPHHRRWDRRGAALFRGVCLMAAVLPLGVLLWLLGGVVVDALPRLGWDFLTSYPSRKWEQAGVLPAMVGSVLLVSGTAAMALPVGIGAAVYLEELAPRGTGGIVERLGRVIEANINNLAGVPSIVYGLLGLEVFVRGLGLGRSLAAGSATLALLVLPVVILSTREALRTVPDSLREAGLALGGTRLQVIARVVLPSALPGILTGAILSVSRALGEAAPLVVVGALAFITFLPDSPSSPYTALPIQIFNWVSRPQKGFAIDAAAAIVVLMATLLFLNLTAILLRARLQRRVR
jgi:phosphate transport system permease protein